MHTNTTSTETFGTSDRLSLNVTVSYEEEKWKSYYNIILFSQGMSATSKGLLIIEIIANCSLTVRVCLARKAALVCAMLISSAVHTCPATLLYNNCRNNSNMLRPRGSCCTSCSLLRNKRPSRHNTTPKYTSSLPLARPSTHPCAQTLSEINGTEEKS